MHLCLCICVCVFVNDNLCMSIRVCVLFFMYLCMCICGCVFVCVYLCIYICVCVFVYLCKFLSDPGVPGVRSMGHDVSKSLTTRGFADLTDVTLADEDSNSTPADDVTRASLGNVAMHVAPSGDQN